MVRFRLILEIIEQENLVEKSAIMGTYLQEQLQILAEKHPVISAVRGRCLLCAFDLPITEQARCFV